MMNYQQTVEYLFNATPVFEKVGASAYKEGLFNSEELDRHFHHPHRHFKTIHIAGTNGKGSCSHTIASILQTDGYKVGLYTSPHLVDFRERIRVNGEPISEDYVVRFVEEERSFFEPLHPSFFELTTAMAFKHFADMEVDIAVIEVGLGGRLDCTNIITPILSVITNISFDHTQFLGNTLAKIAGEKAGIIKPNVPVVIGENHPETRPVFTQKAEQLSSPITFAEDTPEVTKAQTESDGTMSFLSSHYGHVHYGLGGYYQAKNANTVLHAVTCLLQEGVIRHADSIPQGFADVCPNTHIMGRWQICQRSPLVVCDTGHNVGGWQYLSRQIAGVPCRQLRMVFGMVDDKDIQTVMTLLPKNATYYFTKATTHRAIPETKVIEYGAEHGLKGKTYGSVTEAYRAALDDAQPDDFVFVGGSSYIVADFLESIKIS